MIVTSSRQSVAPKTYNLNSGKGTVIGPAYQGLKHIARVYGIYKDIRPYLPEEFLEKHIGKYKYKPGKRIVYALSETRGFLIQKKSKPSAYRLNEECNLLGKCNWHNKN